MMEPFLPRMLKRSGIHVASAGEETDYHGLRAPYFITSQEAVGGMGKELKELHDTIHSHFARQLRVADAPASAIERSAVGPSGGLPGAAERLRELLAPGVAPLFAGKTLASV